MLTYVYPSNRVVSTARGIVLVRFEVDFPSEKFRLSFRELNMDKTIVSSPTVTYDNLEKPDLMMQVADSLPGSTFHQKLMSEQALTNFLPWLPSGGSVADL